MVYIYKCLQLCNLEKLFDNNKIKSKVVNSPILVITPILDFLLFSSARWVFFLLYYQVITKNKFPIRFDAAAFSNIIMLQSSAIDTVAQSSAIVSTYHSLAEL